MVKGLSIVEQNDYKAEAKRIAKNEIRKNDLEKKAKEGGLSPLEKLELAALKIGGFLDGDVFLNSQSLLGNKTGLTSCNVKNDYEPDLDSVKTTDPEDMPLIQLRLNSPEMKELLQRGNAGLDGSVIEEIANLPAKHAKLFLEKDKEGNYLIPTKVLNNFAKNGIKIVVNEKLACPCPEIMTFGQHCRNYYVRKHNGCLKEDARFDGVRGLEISQVGSKAQLITTYDGKYKMYNDSIYGECECETGQTKDLN